MIRQILLLPPLAIARLGSSPQALENYELQPPTDPLGYRQITPAETLEVDPTTGEIRRAYIPKKIRFRDGDRIRPVAPFFELFAETSRGIEQVTIALLKDHGLTPADVTWTVTVGNVKVFRRTGDVKDQVLAIETFCDHSKHALDGGCANFIKDKKLPLGSVQYIKPNAAFPEIRVRFTPAAGIVYGTAKKRKTVNADGKIVEELDPVLVRDEQLVYSPDGKWRGWVDPGQPTDTNPAQIYAGFENPEKGGSQESWGYLDDECDGIIEVALTVDGRPMTAFARFGAGPPTFAPDCIPIRTVADEIEQALQGPSVSPSEATLDRTEEIVRRAFETVRLMNTAVMNGNTIHGRTAIASTMPNQDSNDTSRLFAPIMAPTLVDNLAVRALHQGIFAALRSGSAAWFADVLRMPDEIGDLTDTGRRKMPAMMRGADGRYLTLTRRQIDIIRKYSKLAPAPESSAKGPKK